VLTTQERTARAAALPATMLLKFMTSCGVTRKKKGTVEKLTSFSVKAS
jgi:hypothetical protein